MGVSSRSSGSRAASARVLRLRPPVRYFKAALESASFMKLGPVMSWFLGNIGYHHVHHLNPSIPFYRLPEAMAAIPELQHPTVTNLRPREIVACFQSNLWDEETSRMISYREAARRIAAYAADSASLG